MVADALRMEELLESVADGHDVDWDAAEAAADEAQRPIVRNLRLVAKIAEVHRSASDAAELPPSPMVQTAAAATASSRWGHLVLVERIGEGGFGEVYRAHDPWLDRHVALKLLKADVAAPARLVTEARALARVRHANVVTVHGADMHDGRVGLWMELVHGRTLSAIVAADGPFSADEATVIGAEICRAVAAVHAAGLVHRDIKAQNVMREAGGRVVLMDFGAGHTPLYSAPELLDAGAGATVATDIYALGVLLYFLVTGSYPVRGTSMEALREAHAAGESTSLRDVRPDLSSEFVAVVERALSRDPADRYRSAGDMERALRPSVPRDFGWVAAALLVAVLTGGLAYYATTGRDEGVAHAAVRQVAVLPLRALAGTDEYVAAGVTEAVTQELSMSGVLSVVSRTSVERAAAERTRLPELATALNADAVIEGSVTRHEGRVSVNVRVIEASTNSTVWARTFERPASELSLLQTDIARTIVERFKLTPAGAVESRWRAARQIDPRAYEEYMRGRYELARNSQPGVTGAVTHFERALTIEPGYARAYASLAQANVWLAHFGVRQREPALRAAREAAAEALRLDPALPDAHAAMARIDFQEWNFPTAEAGFRKALTIDPSFVEPRVEFALFLAGRGRFDEAFEQLATARIVDPLSATVADRTAAVFYYARRFPEAATEVDRALRLDPANVGTMLGRVRVLNATGRHQEALSAATAAGRESASHPWFEAEMAQAEAALGRIDAARRRAAALKTPAGEPAARVTPYTLAVAYSRIDRGEALQWLQREVETRSYSVLWMKVDPRLEPLRTDPRFPALLARLQLGP